MDPRAHRFFSQLAEFGPETGSAIEATRVDAREDESAGPVPPREWVVEFEEPRMSAGQTGFLAQMIGQLVDVAPAAPTRPYVRRTLRPGIAFDRKA